MGNEIIPTWATESTTYANYLAAAERCTEAFTATVADEDNTAEFVTIVWGAFLSSIQAPSAKKHLNQLIDDLEKRMVTKLSGFDAQTVRLSDCDWSQMIRKMRIKAACTSF